MLSPGVIGALSLRSFVTQILRVIHITGNVLSCHRQSSSHARISWSLLPTVCVWPFRAIRGIMECALHIVGHARSRGQRRGKSASRPGKGADSAVDTQILVEPNALPCTSPRCPPRQSGSWTSTPPTSAYTSRSCFRTRARTSGPRRARRMGNWGAQEPVAAVVAARRPVRV